MQIFYLGHSSFLMKAKTASLVADPYEEKIGFCFPKTRADIVTISHNHYDHNYIKGVEGKPFVVAGPGEYEEKEVSIVGISTFHDQLKGKERGKNTIYLIHAEDLNICHLGDLGHQLSAKLIDRIGDVDVLFIPVGGVTTLNYKEAAELISKIEPRVVIPMHYKTSQHSPKFSQLTGIEEFLKEMGVAKQAEDKLTLSKSSLREEMEVVVLKS